MQNDVSVNKEVGFVINGKRKLTIICLFLNRIGTEICTLSEKTFFMSNMKKILIFSTSTLMMMMLNADGLDQDSREEMFIRRGKQHSFDFLREKVPFTLNGLCRK